MTIIDNPNKADWSKILQRPTQTIDEIESIVNQVFSDVRAFGDDSIKKYTLKFDNVNLETNVVSNTEIENATSLVSEELKQAIKTAKSNIEKFHKAQITNSIIVETTKGVNCWQEKRPIEKIGL